MPLFSIRRVIQASALFIATTVTAQSCYYPDGSASNDVPCSSTGKDSACCGANALCLDNGLCYGGGLVSRGSCTDKTWGSEACAGYCRTESAGSSIRITPCSSDASDTNKFVCGLDSTNCQNGAKTWAMAGGNSLVLRSSQIAALVEPTLQNSTLATSSKDSVAQTVTSCPSPSTTAIPAGMYTGGQMAGLGCGLGFPLGFALIMAIYLLRREKERHAGPELMYKLPDNHDEFMSRAPPNYRTNSNFSSLGSHTMGGAYSNTSSRRNSIGTTSSGKPIHLQTFAQRFGTERFELAAPADAVRHELDSKRMSTK